MFAQLLGYLLWFAAPVFQLAAIYFMVKRGLRVKFPYFFQYTVFQVLNFAVLFVVYHASPANYFYVYWATSVLSVVLGFTVIHEVFMYCIRPYTGLRDLSTNLFRWAAGLMVVVSVLVGFSGNGSSTAHIGEAIVNVERCIRLMQCGLLLFVLACSNALGISWRNFAVGIALGFGFFASTDLVVYSVRTHISTDWNWLMSMLRSGAYNLAALGWMGYSLAPELAQKRVEVVYLPTLDRWNQAALAVHHGPAITDHTYISEIEQAVDDVMKSNR